ncbi:MAG TPA: pyridoxamine 5'-phosphate oxidase family protein [Alphaproteobacteria bacterium]|jgi:predicted pyridoxine 5'-phosphate oxidase superfamily flavin-nucleotide-binding protein
MSLISDRAPASDLSAGEAPYHAGERAVQARAGVRERAERAGRRMIRDFMLEEHRALFEKLPYVVVGSLDAQDRPWASILTGAPGFMTSPDARLLEIGARPLAGDPLAANLARGAPLGLLGIELETRRRNRMNGTVVSADEKGFAIFVRQSFGNCPQYIQARAHAGANAPANERRPNAVHAEGPRLSAAAAALVRSADTFFIASASANARGDGPGDGVDVSHRGGRPGFVRADAAEGQTVLTAPDFAGNAFYNTFGNLAANPRAGLLFIDFAAGHVLALTGSTEIVWDGPEVAAFAGAQRLLRFSVEDGVWIERAVPLGWSAPEPARQLAATGSWEQPAGWSQEQSGPPRAGRSLIASLRA